MKNTTVGWNIISWFFGLLVLAIGVINIFWGNDFGFGVFILILSFVYYPPANSFLKRRFGFSIHYSLKILLAIFILWAALGVGELFDKVDMMMRDF
jgi:hypothetical protein